jgi:hypothetical protein
MRSTRTVDRHTTVGGWDTRRSCAIRLFFTVWFSGAEQVLGDELFERLEQAIDDGVTVIVGAVTAEIEARISDTLPGAQVFVSGLDWLRGGGGGGSHRRDAAVGRLLLVDREAILVSSIVPSTGDEHVVFGRGFENGLVVIVRRLMATGLLEGLRNADN